MSGLTVLKLKITTDIHFWVICHSGNERSSQAQCIMGCSVLWKQAIQSITFLASLFIAFTLLATSVREAVWKLRDETVWEKQHRGKHYSRPGPSSPEWTKLLHSIWHREKESDSETEHHCENDSDKHTIIWHFNSGFISTVMLHDVHHL